MDPLEDDEEMGEHPTLGLGKYHNSPSHSDRAVDSSNVGFKMLQKFGWKGSGLGKSEQGIKAPIEVKQTDAQLGLGKQTEYDKASTEATKERKKLDVEVEQTEELVKKKIETAERLHNIETDVKNMNGEFYCDVCDKQYKNVAEMSNHLSSYDHHHKKRFKEMKEEEKKRKRGPDVDEAREEQRRREDRRQAMEIQARINKAIELQQLKEHQQSQQASAGSLACTSTSNPSSSSCSSQQPQPYSGTDTVQNSDSATTESNFNNEGMTTTANGSSSSSSGCDNEKKADAPAVKFSMGFAMKKKPGTGSLGLKK